MKFKLKRNVRKEIRTLLTDMEAQTECSIDVLDSNFRTVRVTFHQVKLEESLLNKTYQSHFSADYKTFFIQRIN